MADSQLSVPFVHRVLSFLPEGKPHDSPRLTMAALSPTFRVAVELKDSSTCSESCVVLKRRRDTDEHSMFFRNTILDLSVKQGYELQRSLELVKWWVLRKSTHVLRINTTVYNTVLSDFVLHAHSFWLRRRNAQTISWLSIGTHQLQEATFDHCSSVVDWDCLASLPDLRALSFRHCALHDVSWLSQLTRLETLCIADTATPNPLTLPLRCFPQLRELVVTSFYATLSLECISSCQRLQKLCLTGPLNGAAEIQHAEEIGELSELRTLSCDYCGFKSVSWVTKCSRLETVRLFWCRAINVGPDERYALGALRTAVLSCSSLPSLSWVSDANLLTNLQLNGCRSLASFACLAQLVNLEVVKLDGTTVNDLSPLTSSRDSLQSLYLSNCEMILSFTPLGAFHALERLDLRETSLKDISWITGCVSLKALAVNNCTHLESLDAIAHLEKLTDVECAQTNIKSLAWMEKCHALERVNLSGCKCINPTTVIHSPPPLLKELFLTNSEIEDLSWLVGCPKLQTLVLSHCDKVTDFSWLPRLPTLEVAGLEAEGFKNVSIFTDCKALHSVCVPGNCNEELDELFPQLLQPYTFHFRSVLW